MIVTAKGISVGSTADEVFVRVIGRGTFQNSQPLRLYATEMIGRGYRQFTVDVGECSTMDSTFLGVLAGIGLRLSQQPGTGAVNIVNAETRHRELLVTLGLDRLFVIQLRNGSVAPVAAGVQWHMLPESDVNTVGTPASKEDTARLMLDAHRDLIRADERNLPKFDELTNQLTRRLNKPSSPEEAGHP